MPPLASTLDAITCFSSANCGRHGGTSFGGSLGSSAATILLKHGSPRSGSHSGSPKAAIGIDPSASKTRSSSFGLPGADEEDNVVLNAAFLALCPAQAR